MSHDFYRAAFLGDAAYDAVAFSDPFLPGPGWPNALVIRGAAAEQLLDVSACGVPVEQLPELKDYGLHTVDVPPGTILQDTAQKNMLGFKDMHPWVTAATFFLLRDHDVTIKDVQTSDDLTSGVWQFNLCRPLVQSAIPKGDERLVAKRYVDSTALAVQAFTVAQCVANGRGITDFSVNEDLYNPATLI
ncbi:MAG TPA: hypothetical protein VHT70_05315 [Candidatus Saccharimonadales bacterium]|jgi:hypothetical protein|nr:hypothetical protein [Candidatus Saccharimonadales bacterium]